MPDYSKTVIYMLTCADAPVPEIYVGSTTRWIERKNCHKSRTNNPKTEGYNIPVYQFIRSHGGWENWRMIWVEDFPCESKGEKETRERLWIESTGAQLNSQIPARTKREYIEKNKEHIAEYKKDYYEKNKERIMGNVKDYYLTNLQKCREKRREYNEKNKERISKQRSTQTPCTRCGEVISLRNMSRHQRAQKCLSHHSDM